MLSNPGGQIDPKNIIGRDLLIQQLWRVLKNQSVVLTAARRMGKTSIIKKMTAERVDDFSPVYHDLEGIRSPIDFAEIFYGDVQQYLSTKSKVMHHAHALLKGIGGAEAAGVRLPSIASTHWRLILEKTAQDLETNQEGNIVFFWDEIPMMLENIRVDHGATAAMQVLDVLRSLRQTYPRLRMVYTGSVGLHHVLSTLKEQKHPNSPINDMQSIDVPPLSPENAQKLANLLLEGDGLITSNKASVANAIASGVDNVAFYIQHVVNRLSVSGFASISPVEVDRAIRQLLMTPEHWDMTHYRTRIATYYPSSDIDLTLAVLDSLAVSNTPLSFSEIEKSVSSIASSSNREHLRRLLDALRNDHYLVRDENAAYRFYLPLIQRWWRTDRDLS